MNTYRINADGDRYTGTRTLVMTRTNTVVPTPIGIIEVPHDAYGGDETKTPVTAYYVKDGFAPNNHRFRTKAAAERAIIEHYLGEEVKEAVVV